MPKDNDAIDLHDMINDATLPAEIVEIARELGIEQGTSNVEMLDRIRVHNRSVDADDVEALFTELDCGWDLTLSGITGAISQGDMVGSFSLGERTIHAFAHMGTTSPMDMDDPALTEVFDRIAARRKEAVVLHLTPQVLHVDNDGDKPFLMGGWHLQHGAWTPFLITPMGASDLSAQKELMKDGDLGDLLTDDRSIGLDRTKLAYQFLDKFSIEVSDAIEAAALRLQESALQITIKEDPIDLAPKPIVSSLRDIFPDDEDRVASFVETLGNLTYGFAGLNDENMAGVTPAQLQSIMNCATAQVDPEELRIELETFFGWEVLDCAPANPDRQDLYVGHGDAAVAIEVDDCEVPIPVFLHGGTIDPEAETENFALRVNKLVVEDMTEGGPAIILAMNPMAWEAPPSLLFEEKALAIVAGCVLGRDGWLPFTFGDYESSPFINAIKDTGDITQNPAELDYTFSVLDAFGDPVSPMRILMEYQSTMDFSHDLGPAAEHRGNIDELADSYKLRYWSEKRFTLVDPRQEKVYGLL